MINRNEIELADYCIEYAMKCGASGARVSLSKSVMDSCAMFNGEIDKVTHSADRSIYLYIFADGRYGTFSTNRLEKPELEEFVQQAITMTKMLGEDSCRTLPDPSRTAKDAVTGLELGLYDEAYEAMDTDRRLALAAEVSVFNKLEEAEGYKVISEECEYSDSVDDNYTADSQGFRGRHKETGASCFSEMTIEDTEGNKYSGYWWDSAIKMDGIDIKGCSAKALERAVSQIGPQKRKGGKYKMVVDANAAAKFVSPILAALNATSIQQKMSFLEGKLGEKVFGEGLTIIDMGRTYGKTGSRLYDTEGVAVKDAPLVENGVVKQYFVNTYMSNKMGIPATVEDISRPCLMPWLKGEDLPSEEKGVSLKDILSRCGNGIYVTGFNGGNCNPVSGDFSFGIEGFAFKNGKVSHPVREMLVTGNLIEIWNNLLAVGSDARPASRWQIPTLAFEGVSFSS